MIERTAVKVEDSAAAALFLHTENVLQNNSLEEKSSSKEGLRLVCLK
jgi:hypothetical protein